jgi:hypothetical protein
MYLHVLTVPLLLLLLVCWFCCCCCCCCCWWCAGFAAAGAGVVPAVIAISDEPVFEIFESYDDGNYCSVVYLSNLESLTRLTLNVNYQGCDEIFWRSMAELESLRHLSINGLNKADLGGIVRLDSCKQFTCLETDNDEEWPGFSMTVSGPKTMISLLA